MHIEGVQKRMISLCDSIPLATEDLFEDDSIAGLVPDLDCLAYYDEDA